MSGGEVSAYRMTPGRWAVYQGDLEVDGKEELYAVMLPIVFRDSFESGDATAWSSMPPWGIGMKGASFQLASIVSLMSSRQVETCHRSHRCQLDPASPSSPVGDSSDGGAARWIPAQPACCWVTSA